MKKVLMILLAFAMVFSMAGVVSAEETKAVSGASGDSGDVEVSHEIPDNCIVSMPVTIPLSVATAFTDEFSEVTLTVTKLQVATGNSLYVTMKSGNGFMVNDSDESSIPYFAGLKNANDEYVECTNGQVVLTASAKDVSASMKFFAKDEDIKEAKNGGKHTDTLTFTYSFVSTEKTTVADSAEDIISAAAGGNDILMTDDISTVTSSSGYGGADIKVNGGVFDGNGNTLSVDGSGDYTAIKTAGGTIKNLAIDDGFRGIFLEKITEDVYLDNVKLGGDGVCYCINTGVNYGDYSLIVTNSEINGWTSFAQIKSASFTNCDFGQGTYYTNVDGRLVKPYVNTVFDRCTFIEGFYIDLSSLESGCKVTLKDCTVLNGAEITIDSVYSDTFDESNEKIFIELPSGRALADCVIFE